VRGVPLRCKSIILLWNLNGRLSKNMVPAQETILSQFYPRPPIGITRAVKTIPIRIRIGDKIGINKWDKNRIRVSQREYEYGIISEYKRWDKLRITLILIQ
jgi:hypothetical protein